MEQVETVGTQQEILGLCPESLSEWLGAQDEPAYRAGQILRWVYAERVDSFDAMTNLPLRLRTRLRDSFTFFSPRTIDRLRAGDGRSEKFLFQLEDGEEIESVWMNDGGRSTFCLSSQAGCGLNCRFCATGAAGFGRDLKLKEILGQVLAMAREKGGPANIVFMGMGEPLLNVGAVIPALESLADPQRFALGARRIAVSTAGVTPGIRELRNAPVRPNLALSLNSPFDEQRSELMPVNRRYPLAGALEACADYGARTGRRVIFEYVLLGGVNTSVAAARAVAGLASGLGALLNLIPFNPVARCAFRPPGDGEVSQFRGVLERSGIKVTQRFRRGRDIAAGCGQLKGKHPRVAAATPDRRASDRAHG